MYIEREIQPTVQSVARSFPSLLVSGPRQVGKSTLLRHLFPQATLYNLDSAFTRAALEDTPSLLVPSQTPLLLDEIQKLPSLLEVLKSHIDANRDRNGLYLLTGSEQFKLMRGVRESLAGRIGLMNLYPLGVAELLTGGLLGTARADLLRVLFRGGYPDLWTDRAAPIEVWMSSYFETYLQRDIELQFGVKHLREFIHFLKMLALRAGQLLNFSDLARDVHISDATAREWVSILERSFIIQTVSPWHVNQTKRLVKMPKVYFVDTGLLCYLLGMTSEEHLERYPKIGAVFENFIFSEILKTLSVSHHMSGIYFYRTADGDEIDYIVEHKGQRIGIEVKFTENPGTGAAKILQQLMSAGQLDAVAVVCAGDSLDLIQTERFKRISWWQVRALFG